MNIERLTNNLRLYISQQLDTMSTNTPIVGFMRPFIERAINKNFNKVSGFLGLISDENGNIDIENILQEMLNNMINTKPFTVNTSIIGDIEIGGGQIKLNIPLTDRKLILNTEDIDKFKQLILNN